jgi:MoaA/NifB/PqqE/SkfB family radical SAM enzyme
VNLTRYLSTYKLINFSKLIISHLFSSYNLFKIQNIYPHFISIESTNFCNLHCPECPVGIRKNSLTEKTTFNFDIYKKLIDELSRTLYHVILYFQGEPFLNNRLVELISYTHNAGIYTSTSTNGQFLNKIVSKDIVLSGLDKLIISVDGYTQEVYETYRIGGNLQKAIEGIKNIVEWKKELKSLTPFVEIQFLVLKTNEHQIKEMKKLAKVLKVDRLIFKTAQLYDFENGSELMTTINRYSRYKKTVDGTYIIKGRQPNHCWRMWSGAVINVHGDVLPCCFDKLSENSYGSMVDCTFASCWQGTKAVNFRKGIINHRKQVDMCKNCTN